MPDPADPTVTFWAPLVVGLAVGVILWALPEGVRAWVAIVGGRRSRRPKIISIMGRAVALQARAIQDGRFQDAYIEDSERPIAAVREKYDDLTAQALDLFEAEEDVVAFWTAVEFYAGWYAPLKMLRSSGVPRHKPEAHAQLIPPSGWGWEAARPQELAEWAQVRWPWDRGNGRGPRYGDLLNVGENFRHNIVIPNSDVNSDMLRPFALYLGRDDRGPFHPPSKRESRRLKLRYRDANQQLESQQGPVAPSTNEEAEEPTLPGH